MFLRSLGKIWANSVKFTVFWVTPVQNMFEIPIWARSKSSIVATDLPTCPVPVITVSTPRNLPFEVSNWLHLLHCPHDYGHEISLLKPLKLLKTHRQRTVILTQAELRSFLSFVLSSLFYPEFFWSSKSVTLLGELFKKSRPVYQAGGIFLYGLSWAIWRVSRALWLGNGFRSCD